MANAVNVDESAVGMEDHHIALIPDELWKQLEEVGLREELKNNEVVALMLMYACENRESFEAWLYELKRLHYASRYR